MICTLMASLLMAYPQSLHMCAPKADANNVPNVCGLFRFSIVAAANFSTSVGSGSASRSVCNAASNWAVPVFSMPQF